MNQNRTDKRTAQERFGQGEPREQSAREQGARGADERRDESQRKASTIEQRAWRGEGVCGDRHTD